MRSCSQRKGGLNEGLNNMRVWALQLVIWVNNMRMWALQLVIWVNNIAGKKTESAK